MDADFDPGEVLTELQITSARQLVVVTGAGASTEHPSHAPLGIDLMMTALNSYFVPHLHREIHRAYEQLQEITGAPRRSFAGRPRLEAVLDVVAKSHGYPALDQLTAFFVEREPNRVHKLLAEHLVAGGRQVTANFDRLVEQALGERPAVLPHHFHSSVGRVGEALPFGARLAAIEHGFNDIDREAMLSELVAPEVSAVAWFGYSFSDYFDVTPAVVAAINEGKLDGKAFIWFDFNPANPHISEIDGEDIPEVVGAALLRGLQVKKISGRSGDALYLLLESLDCALDARWARADSCDGADLFTGPELLTEPAAKVRASVDLLRRFGLLGALVKGTGVLGLDIEDLPGDAAAEYWWKKGAYTTAYRAALSLLDRKDPLYRIRRLLLGARYDWIQGRLVRACIRTVKAIRAIDRDSEAPKLLYAEALERLGRIAVAMHRSPDTRYFILPLLRRSLIIYVDRMSDLEKDNTAIPGVLIAHAEDALRGYQSEVLDLDKSSGAFNIANQRRRLIERFSESESLDSYIDYVRANANIGFWDFPLPAGAEWQEQMAKLYGVVGNDADIYRMTLLTRHRHPRHVADASRAALLLDVSFWQRVRMFTLFLINSHRARSSMRD